MEDCVKRIVDLCTDTGISRNKLCREIGIPVTTLSNYIIRGGMPNYETLKKISAYFGVSVEYLDTGIEPEFNVEKEVNELVSRIAVLPQEQQGKVLAVMYKILGSYE